MTNDETPLPPHGHAPASAPTNADDALLPCSVCGNEARRVVLSLYGTRCRSCFEAYARAALRPLPHRIDTQAQREIRAGLRREPLRSVDE